ncbi:MAG: GTP-binding protein [Lachnospiraceae bacterium]|nr:GTP-binding protein [Lachnospiraceae bacterium]
MISDKLTLGILAHVDSGKTTLSENLLYLNGQIRNIGRVDYGNTLLDNNLIERKRGITIYSKQAVLDMGKFKVTLVDTPGHVDFSAEMERTLQILDYAILVISGSDGVQGHTLTLWKLLLRYKIPVFIFVNKMDQVGTDKELLMKNIKANLSEHCVDFSDINSDEFTENIVMSDEGLMDEYLKGINPSEEDIAYLINDRKIFPCYFGSALKQEGVEELSKGMEKYFIEREYPDKLGIRVYKIGRDENGNRLSYIKVTGGELKVKEMLGEAGKVDQIRIYSGGGYNTVTSIEAGGMCAVTGLDKTRAGEGLGIEAGEIQPLLEPVLNYRIIIPETVSVNVILPKLKELEEEEPELNITWDEELCEIHAKVMGDIQIEILKSVIEERYGISVEFDTGNVVYKETIVDSAYGVGHYEPLKHYAEVHVVIEPLKRGSGVHIETSCSEDVLDRNWQRLIMTHLREKMHRGVLTGSQITDVRFELIAGRAHKKHTEGGDFRQATYRAVRNGLAHAKSILLEPVYSFKLEIPTENVGRAISDIQRMYGEFDTPYTEGNMTVITGYAPVVTMNGYQREVMAYTKGMGRIFYNVDGYRKCHNEEEIIEQKGYDFESDINDPASSIFCSGGAGFVVKWDKVKEYMHVENQLKKNNADKVKEAKNIRNCKTTCYDEKELEAIFERTYGAIKRDRNKWTRRDNTSIANVKKNSVAHLSSSKPEYLLIDGYNIIFAWDELKDIAKVNLQGARDALIEKVSNYQGYRQINIIIVFDAYKVSGNPGEILRFNNVDIVYTKEAETADTYIERVTHEIGKKYRVTVATSDGHEQCIIWGNGATRLSAKGFIEEIERIENQIREIIN